MGRLWYGTSLAKHSTPRRAKKANCDIELRRSAHPSLALSTKVAARAKRSFTKNEMPGLVPGSPAPALDLAGNVDPRVGAGKYRSIDRSERVDTRIARHSGIGRRPGPAPVDGFEYRIALRPLHRLNRSTHHPTPQPSRSRACIPTPTLVATLVMEGSCALPNQRLRPYDPRRTSGICRAAVGRCAVAFDDSTVKKVSPLRHRLRPTWVAAREAGKVKRQCAKEIEDRLSGSPRVSVSFSRGDSPEAGNGQ